MAISPSSTVSDIEVLSQFLDRQINGVVDGYLRDLAVQQQQNSLSAHKLDTLLNAVQSIGQRMDALDKQLVTLRNYSAPHRDPQHSGAGLTRQDVVRHQ